MPKFLTIGYGDRAGYDRTPASVREAAHAHDARLAADGAMLATAGRPVQVRNAENRGVRTQRGAYSTATLPVAGFGLIDAATLDEAIDLAAKSPCAVAHGVIEVWPLYVAEAP